MQRPLPADHTVFNLGTGVEHTVRDVAEMLEDIHGGPLRLEWGTVARQRWDSPRWVADTTRQTTDLGFAAETKLRDGLRATYLWFAENADHHEEYDEPR